MLLESFKGISIPHTHAEGVMQSALSIYCLFVIIHDVASGDSGIRVVIGKNHRIVRDVFSLIVSKHSTVAKST